MHGLRVTVLLESVNSSCPHGTLENSMRQSWALLLALLPLSLVAQTPVPTQAPSATLEMSTTRMQVQKVEYLVKIGALPRVKLDQVHDLLADAEDAEVLQRTFYGPLSVQQMTEQQSAEMVAAAQRRVARQQTRVADLNKLVDSGIAAINDLQPARDELRFRETTLSLAQSRADLLKTLVEMAREEQQMESEPAPDSSQVMQHFPGKGSFAPADLRRIEAAYRKRFERDLPISALGETAVHRALGFDHRGRVDVALSPDRPEGEWLIHFLTINDIPFYAFRHAVPGKATAAHIHLGPGSTRLKLAAASAD